MPTDAQLAANRANARKSTGPRTDAGKSASRMNALKSGLHARSLIIRGEDPEALAQLAAEYNAEFHPVTARQRDLVDTIVRNEWKIRRLERLEADLWDERFDAIDDWNTGSNPRLERRRLRHPLSCAFNDELEKRLENLQRRVHAYERSTARALKELQSRAGASVCQPAEGPELIETEPSPQEIGFVPSTPVPLTPTHPSPSPEPRPPAPIGFVPSNRPAATPPNPLAG